MGAEQIIGGLLQLPKIASNIAWGLRAKKALKKLPVVADPTYEVSDYEKQNLANYQNAYNTGMLPGQAIQQQQIIDDASNAGAGLSRNLTSSSQRAMATGQLQGQRDASMQNFWGQVGQQKMGLLGGLSQGLARMTGETDKMYNDRLRKYNENQATRAALMQTRFNMSQDIGNIAANFGGALAGGGMGKGGGSTGNSYGMPPSYFMPPQAGGIASRLNWIGNQNKKYRSAMDQYTIE